MTKPTYEQLEVHLNKCQSQRARLENQLSERDRQMTLLRKAGSYLLKDVGEDSSMPGAVDMRLALSATEPKP